MYWACDRENGSLSYWVTNMCMYVCVCILWIWTRDIHYFCTWFKLHNCFPFKSCNNRAESTPIHSTFSWRILPVPKYSIYTHIQWYSCECVHVIHNYWTIIPNYNTGNDSVIQIRPLLSSLCFTTMILNVALHLIVIDDGEYFVSFMCPCRCASCNSI